MMEKPLAVSMEHARAIEAAARKGGIQAVVNYETTWHPANHAAYALIHERNEIGELRKLVVHDGHQGPKEIGCSAAFLEWLTDPVLNGGGALTDFGCYGADLTSWLMKGQRPTSVWAVSQQIKPEVHPKADDEATSVLTYQTLPYPRHRGQDDGLNALPKARTPSKPPAPSSSSSGWPGRADADAGPSKTGSS